MTESHEKYVVTNCLKIAYDSLRVLGRFVQGSHLSPYKEFFEKLLDRKLDGEVPNSEVEAYYLNRLTESDFVNAAESRVFAGNYGGMCVYKISLVCFEIVHSRLRPHCTSPIRCVGH